MIFICNIESMCTSSEWCQNVAFLTVNQQLKFKNMRRKTLLQNIVFIYIVTKCSISDCKLNLSNHKSVLYLVA